MKTYCITQEALLNAGSNLNGKEIQKRGGDMCTYSG